MSCKITTVPDGSIENLKTRLKQRGWHQLGAGLFSAAYGTRTSRVVWKITKESDAGAWCYLQAIATGALTGPHFPKLGVILREETTGRFAVLMERLQGIKENHAETPDEERKLMKARCDYSWARDIAYNYTTASCGHYVKQATDNKVAPSLIRAFLAMSAELAKEWRFDLHNGNAMIRRDGTLVVTDPVAFAAS